MSSSVQNINQKIRRHAVVCASATAAAAAAVDKNSPRRTVIELKELIVDGGSPSNCCETDTPLSPPPLPPSESVNKTMPSTIDDNNMQCDSNDCGDDLCAQTTAATDDDTNNKENVKQKVRAHGQVPASFLFFIFCGVNFREFRLRQFSCRCRNGICIVYAPTNRSCMMQFTITVRVFTQFLHCLCQRSGCIWC